MHILSNGVNVQSFMCHKKTTLKYESADSGETMWALKPLSLCPGGLAKDGENEAGCRRHPENTTSALHSTVTSCDNTLVSTGVRLHSSSSTAEEKASSPRQLLQPTHTATTARLQLQQLLCLTQPAAILS